jgi:hypothetical protein
MAIRFEEAFVVEADTLLRMEAAHALAEARAGRMRLGWRRLGVENRYSVPSLLVSPHS